MASDWCICNIGTGHAADERDNILVKTFEAVKAGFINNGPGHRKGDLMGNMFGHGLEDRLEKSMAGIPADARRIFVVGHSRGAILSYLLANELHRTRPGLEVHIFNIDPVARYAKNTSDKEMVQRNVRSVKAIVMENDNMVDVGFGSLFQLTFVRKPTMVDIEYIPMPGTHGSATQVNAHNPIGMAAYQMVLRWLDGHGVPLKVQPAPPPSVCNTFFEIHEANPARGFTASGGVSARLVTDWDAKKPKEVEQSGEQRREMLARGGLSNPHSSGGGDKLANPGVFINAYHANLFRTCYPGSHGLVTMSATEMGRLRVTPGARTTIQRELGTLRSYQATWRVLTSIGLANRLERAASSPV